MTLSDALRKLADELQDWDGTLHCHSHTVTSEQELVAWTKFLDKPAVMHHMAGNSYHTVHGHVGPLHIFVQYAPGLLGETPPPPPQPPAEAPSHKKSEARLNALLGYTEPVELNS